MTVVKISVLVITVLLLGSNDLIPWASGFSSPASAYQRFAARPTFGHHHCSYRRTNGLYMASDDTNDEPGKSKLVRLPNSSVEITLTASPKQTKSAYDRVSAELSKQVNVPGFRKGAKIPPPVLESAMAAKGGRNAIRAEAIKHLLGEMVEPAIKTEHKLAPIGQPVLSVKVEELAESFVPGESCEMVVRCDVWPDVRWKDSSEEKPYYGLKGKYKRKPFNQERFDAALVDLRDRYATLEPMNDDEALDWGDACVVNMAGYLAQPDGTKGDPLPNAASGDNVEIVLGVGRYMEGLAEGLLGGVAGETKTISVAFPEKLRDKSLAGKKAVFDVTINQASHRVLPELNDEFSNQVRPGLSLESLEAELRKAIDEEDAKDFIDERNAALGMALAEVMDVEVPDTVVTNQAREKYAVMMSDMREGGMADDEIKKLITPENFLKYKDICAEDVIRDFRVSVATDEVAKAENIEVPSNQVDEQMAALRKQAEGEEFDETQMRSKVESALQRRMVFDLLAEHADLEVEYVEEKFDEELMQKLADESLEREKGAA